MYNPITLISIVCLYVGFLFLVALLVERDTAGLKQLAKSPIVYSLALAVYCTSWTYYGSVGSAANAGMLFLTIYLGPTMMIGLWWFVVRKLVRIKTAQRITSIADFISARYGKSQGLAAIATLLALIGTTPYIALQLKAVTSTFTLITVSGSTTDAWIGRNVGPIVVGLMIIFTIVIGVRRLDPTERHEGVMAALAVECVVKLLAFLAAGVFVTYFIYDGFGDIFQRVSESELDMFNKAGQGVSSYLMWMTYLVLAMSAIMFLPRQFHVTVVENSNEKHLKTAMWLFPLYLFLINIFVVPIAAGGLLQGRQPASEADTFVLSLPLLLNQSELALAVFIGGFSAATGMIIVSSMTTATMVTNHLVLPMVSWAPWLRFLQRYLLRVRWVAVGAILIMGYGFEQVTGESYTLVNMGIISFAAVLQFAPSILGGLFWRQGNRGGAILGLSSGFVIWFYTLLLPSFVKSGWLAESLLNEGPFGLGFLKPEQLFGVVGLGSIPHAVFWTMSFNIGLYVLGSLYFEKKETETRLADEFVDALAIDRSLRPLMLKEADIELTDKTKVMANLLSRYFTDAEVAAIIQRCLDTVEIGKSSLVSVTQLAEFYNEVEKSLAGSIGAASAHQVLSQAQLFTHEESLSLSEVYGEILTELRVSPEELRERIDYYHERATLLTNQAAELEQQVSERTQALEITSEISHQMTTILDIDELLKDVVQRVQAGFNYYCAHIYMVDRENNCLTMVEGAGQAVQQLKERGHFLPIGEGIVGTVASTNKYFLSNNINEMPNFVPNLLLPDTRAELAVPLRKGEQVLGVLDLHSDQIDRFTPVDVSRVQSIANQLAVTIDNARLLTETRTALEQVERLNRRLTREGWDEFSKEVQAAGYRFVGGIGSKIIPASDAWLPPMAQAAAKKQLVKQTQDGNGDKRETELAVPLILRGEVIGVLGVKREETPDWADEEVAAVEAVADQVSRALENARLSQEQKKTIYQLKEVDRLKSEFLTSMSHELRTPLNSIIGFADVLLQGIDGELNDLATNDIQLIYNSGQHLLALINDILDLSKIEAGQMELVREPLDIQEVIDEVLSASSAMLKDKHIGVVVETADTAPIYADKLRLHQVLLNLVSNAAKFTEKGTITIKTELKELMPDKMRVSVIDTGIGIPPDKLEAVFDRFRQADSSTTRKYGGSGLGLAICKQLVELHGGELGATSEEGVGSVFYFTIPLADAVTSGDGPVAVGAND